MNTSTHRFTRSTALTLVLAAGWCSLAAAQPPAGGGGGGGGFQIPNLVGPSGGMGGGGPMGQERKLLKKFDADNSGQLNIEEREAARAFIKKERESRSAGGGTVSRRPGPGGPGGGMRGPGGMGGEEEKASPGAMVSQADVQPVTGDLYDPSVLRTIFLDFDHSDWEAELEDFNNTDVEVPATMTVDGKKYPGVGVHFRGQSSYFGVRTGHKRSLNVSVDFTEQDLAIATPTAAGKKGEGTYKTLNLLNSHEDASFMSSVLYSAIANQYIPAPRANYVRVVINGESWGVYVNIEQFNKDFVKRNFKEKASDGSTNREAGKSGGGREARWKVKGNPGARSGLEYTGDDAAAYKQKYQIKSADKESDWEDLIHLCKVLNTTPPDQLESALAPILDIDATLKFLALDVVLANGDGYWTRSSDYSLYKDKAGKFHITPHDMNEAFKSSLMMPGGGGGGRRQGGPGGPGGAGVPGGPNGGGPEMRRPEGDALPMDGRPGPDGPPGDVVVPRDGQGQPAPDQPRRGRGGQGGGGGRGGQSGTELDPLVGLNDSAKPLRSKLLAVPALRERYMGYVREIAEKNLDWANLGKVVAANRAVIEEALEADTRKLSSIAAFRSMTADEPAATGTAGRRESMNLRTFAEKRRAYLLSYVPKDPPAPQVPAAAVQPTKEVEQR